MTSTATVFISYAWESDAFRAQVKALRDYLLANGVAVVSDFDHAILPADVGWPIWMQHSIEDATMVLVVSSKSYKERVEKRASPTTGKGVAWEGAVMTQYLYNMALRNDKFYPIFPDPFDFSFCPTMLQAWSNGHAFPSRQADILALVRMRLGLPALAAPAAVAADNPYDPWHPAQGARFFGREDLLRALQQALEQKRSMSLVGDRRIGKSSLLLAWQARAQGLGRVVRRVDGLEGDVLSCRGLVSALIGQDIGSNGGQDEAEYAANALAKWAEQFVILPALVLLDEAEPMLQQLPHRFFERLRGLINQGKLCLVLATARPVDRVFESVGRTSPFANLLAIKRVGLLELAAAEQLVALGDALWQDGQRQFMRQWAGRHPLFLALCGWHMWQALVDGLGQQQMLDGLNEDAFARLRELDKSLTEQERAFLVQMAQGAVVSTDGTPLRGRGWVLAGAGGDGLFGEVLASWLKSGN